MNLLLLIRGPIRRNMDECISNINTMKGLLRDHNYSTLYVGWSDDKNIDCINSKIADEFFFLRDPLIDKEYYIKNIPSFIDTPPIGGREGLFHMNSLRTILAMRNVCGFIKNNYPTVDYIVMTRADTFINFESIDKFFDKEKYVMPTANIFGAQCSKKDEGMCDIFGVAVPDIFCKTWDIGENYLGGMEDIFKISVGYECIPVYISEKNNVEKRAEPVSELRVTYR